MGIHTIGYPSKSQHLQFLVNLEHVERNETLQEEIDFYVDTVIEREDDFLDVFRTYKMAHIGRIISSYNECIDFIQNPDNEIFHVWNSDEELYNELKEFWNQNPDGFITFE